MIYRQNVEKRASRFLLQLGAISQVNVDCLVSRVSFGVYHEGSDFMSSCSCEKSENLRQKDQETPLQWESLRQYSTCPPAEGSPFEPQTLTKSSGEEVRRMNHSIFGVVFE